MDLADCNPIDPKSGETPTSKWAEQKTSRVKKTRKTPAVANKRHRGREWGFIQKDK